MALWGIDKMRNRRISPPRAITEANAADPISREAIEERLLLFQTGKALEAPLRFMKWAERVGTANSDEEAVFQRNEAEMAMGQITRMLQTNPELAVQTQGERVTRRAMDLIRPMRDPVK